MSTKYINPWMPRACYVMKIKEKDRRNQFINWFLSQTFFNYKWTYILSFLFSRSVVNIFSTLILVFFFNNNTSLLLMFFFLCIEDCKHSVNQWCIYVLLLPFSSKHSGIITALNNSLSKYHFAWKTAAHSYVQSSLSKHRRLFFFIWAYRTQQKKIQNPSNNHSGTPHSFEHSESI